MLMIFVLMYDDGLCVCVAERHPELLPGVAAQHRQHPTGGFVVHMSVQSVSGAVASAR